MKITIEMTKVANDQYFCGGTRLAFDYPWAIYIVNNDQVIPYYRVYINNRCVHFTRYEHQAYAYLKGLTMEQAHQPVIEKEADAT